MRAQCDHTVVIATGGFVSAPVANAARAERVPFILVNLDATPGKANRFAARHAAARLTAADGSAPPTWERIRPIVRARAVASIETAACRAAFGLSPDTPTLLVTGASQGARSINQFMQAFAERHPDALTGWQVIHQTGADADPSLASTYADAGIPARVVPFIEAIGEAWGAADLAVSRSGAGSVAEAWANATPTLFLPYPHHKDEHQRRNALPVVDAGASAVCTDHVDAERNLADAGQRLKRLLNSVGERNSMKMSYSRLGPADGARQVAEVALRLCRR
jgi:UDP-N-acetylglucosamine--N-acetylmuramyl-(pentapeptide) pyrophosphoryl-undecaprenol N-acetylglucosamine transferase